MGQLPKRLLASKEPFCAACQYEKMTRRPWRVNGDNKNATKTATRPGQIVLVDQIRIELTWPDHTAQGQAYPTTIQIYNGGG